MVGDAVLSETVALSFAILCYFAGGFSWWLTLAKFRPLLKLRVNGTRASSGYVFT
jgi:hypothetical protein